MASDILDVLNIKEETRVSNSQPKKQQHKDDFTHGLGPANKKRKNGAMNRELYNLIGTNVPPVAVEKTIKFKDKIKAVAAVPWTWAPFKNGARNDDLQFHHWVKGNSNDIDSNKPYNFERYNTKLDIPEFNEDEYNDLLKDVNSDWDYNETKYLFELAKDFDLRWAVIFDRYEYQGDPSKERTLEDLKEQLYKCAAKILSNKKDGIKDSVLIKNLESFDKKLEIERKQYLDKLIHRAPTEIAEEESLVIEARKFELAAKKMLMERAQLLQLLDSPQSSASIQQYLTSSGLAQLYNTLMTVDKSKKRKPEAPVAPQLGPNAIPHTQQIQQQQAQQQQAQQQQQQQQQAQAQAQAQQHSKSQKDGKLQSRSNRKQKDATSTATNTISAPIKSEQKAIVDLDADISQINQPKNEAIQMIQSKMTPEEMEAFGLKIHDEKIQPGVYIRSQKLSTFKPAVQSKVVEILNEMGISQKPTIPTAKVCAKYDQLLQSIASLIDLKKQADKIEAEVSLIKAQKGVQ
ncbi:hypothetical protein CANARDRAFT_25938 [[Candida] arabinofermentans NRRL YB-2248]|uniref:SWR1-complex protein 4 n=1 Tax=[Candida] arabinofermentans NRRL YB-2248 TaxID=983967 RepID=A0A1E4T7G7_9ASCO|nr:hypothetical protein CANARDRAFT_25938 [[Candida] arabinofermentans NRRL YB-2248]